MRREGPKTTNHVCFFCGVSRVCACTRAPGPCRPPGGDLSGALGLPLTVFQSRRPTAVTRGERAPLSSERHFHGVCPERLTNIARGEEGGRSWGASCVLEAREKWRVNRTEMPPETSEKTCGRRGTSSGTRERRGRARCCCSRKNNDRPRRVKLAQYIQGMYTFTTFLAEFMGEPLRD